MKSILIVEDDSSILESLEEFLIEDGFDVLKASNGKEAIELLNASAKLPGAILLDLMMPVMDGIQFRAEQEKDPRVSEIPVILMSADPQIESVRMKIGAVYYMRKPLDIEVLSEKLKEIVSDS